ncbi:MAG TPA: 30S ribosomal protein S12 methylthiotransferase RimO [Syntrophus sp. (in: bacteria)]|jgi:ribosomal protein S12 methylthiotransferase|nr:30S ribosomal protein S12 methylthiotransferase RimO [Syntrophus sp. (in: bacteria)]
MKKKRFHILSLGCPKNLVDSEVMAALLTSRGYRITRSPQDAHILIINTCAFILPAKEEAIETILLMAQYKRTGACTYLVATGCLPQRYGLDLASVLPEVDLFLGTAEVPYIADHLARLESGANSDMKVKVGKPDFLMRSVHPRLLMTPAYSAYLKIAEGCGNHCAYCIIPDIRGQARSRPREDILAEARVLAGQGVKELIVIAQDTTAYGRDLRGRPSLTRLLKELAAVDGIAWIRLLYAYPTKITRELIRCLNGEKKICSYLDMPIQHIDDDILRAMHRHGDGQDLREVIGMVRDAGPGIAIRTSLIVGFPGETVRKFDRLMDFVREIRFDHLGVFTYSREEGTAASTLPSRISEAEKSRRREAVMEEQSSISFAILQQRVGSLDEVLIEGKSDLNDYPFIGRSSRQAPEIDGLTYVRGKRLKPGQIVSVRIREASEYDLFAERIDIS